MTIQEIKDSGLLAYEFVIGMAMNINRYNLSTKEEVE